MADDRTFRMWVIIAGGISVVKVILNQPAMRKETAMTDATNEKFLVLYLIPSSVMADWAKTDPTIRQAEDMGEVDG